MDVLGVWEGDEAQQASGTPLDVTQVLVGAQTR